MPVPRGRSFDLHSTGWLNKKQATSELSISPTKTHQLNMARFYTQIRVT